VKPINSFVSEFPIDQQLIVRRLGRAVYEPIWEVMKSFTAERTEATVDELWLLEHEPVFTQGQAGKAEHVLNPGDIPVVQVDRGGQVTYHGPGQLVGYLLVDIARKKIGARELVTRIENVVVNTLAHFGVESYPRSDAPGVYVGEAKIASLGLRIKRGCSFHGLAINVNGDMEPFLRINPCGYGGLQMVRLDQFAANTQVAQVEDELVREFVTLMAYNDVRLEGAISLPK
jgi:lipoyl(octanoyl) transferase